MTLKLWTDFNEVYDDDYVWTSMRNTASVIRPPSLGEWVELYDDSGEGCWAVVVEVDGPIVSCKIDWSTWRSMRSAVGSGVISGESHSEMIVTSADSLVLAS